MPGFGSMDDIVNALTVSGQFRRIDWTKQSFTATTWTAGLWYCLAVGAGNPSPNTAFGAGTALGFQTLDDAKDGAILHGGHVSPATKHILNASAFSAVAASCPCVLLLVDLLGFYYIDVANYTAGTKTFVNSATFTTAFATNIVTHAALDVKSYTRVRVTTSAADLPVPLAINTDYWTVRESASTSKLYPTYADALAGTNVIDIEDDGTGTHTIWVLIPRYVDGVGVMPFLTVSGAILTAGGGSIQLSYTNTVPTGARACPTSPSLPLGNATASGMSVLHSGSALGKFGPFLPLQAGDLGVRSVESITWAATVYTTTGAINLCLARPLLSLPLTTVAVAGERDLVNQLPSLPRIYDGAYLAWMLYAGAATTINTPFYGHLDVGWK